MARKMAPGKEPSRPRERRRPQGTRRRFSVHNPYVLPFQSRHYGLFGIGALVILTGFITLGFGSITLAPLFLIIGYCVLIPLALLWNRQSETGQAPRDEAQS